MRFAICHVRANARKKLFETALKDLNSRHNNGKNVLFIHLATLSRLQCDSLPAETAAWVSFSDFLLNLGLETHQGIRYLSIFSTHQQPHFIQRLPHLATIRRQHSSTSTLRVDADLRDGLNALTIADGPKKLLDLPRELRDRIYDYVFQVTKLVPERVFEKSGSRMRLYAIHFPINLILINHDFHNEVQHYLTTRWKAYLRLDSVCYLQSLQNTIPNVYHGRITNVRSSGLISTASVNLEFQIFPNLSYTLILIGDIRQTLSKEDQERFEAILSDPERKAAGFLNARLDEALKSQEASSVHDHTQKYLEQGVSIEYFFRVYLYEAVDKPPDAIKSMQWSILIMECILRLALRDAWTRMNI